MLRRKKWLPIAFIVFFVQLILEGFAAFTIVRLNMLPDKYLLAIFAGLLLMLVITALLFFAGTGHGPSKGRRIRRILAIVLAVLMGLGSVMAATMVSRINKTVDTVTETQKTLQAMVGVYVMSNDSAIKVEDAKDYSFGVMANFDQENTTYAVNYLNQQLGKTITTVERPSMTENADALYNGAVKAMIMNEAYVSALTDFEGYQDFEEKTRLLLEIPVEKIEEVDASENTGLNDGTDGADSNKAAALESQAAKSDITKEPFCLYISGSDTRSAILDTSRSDVNILMVVNPTTKQILLLNTPRDYYVPNPAGGGALDKLTHCGIYGVECSEKALADLYQTEVNYYGQINFTGFETLIDALGGVTVESPQDFEAGGFSYKEGPNTLNGKQALAFARERYAFASGDNMRGRNQMRVITAVIQKISSSGASVLMNYGDILDSLEGMFVTDLSSNDLAALVKMQLNDGGSWNVKSYAVTGQGGSETTYSAPNNYAYVMYQDENMVKHAAELIDKVEDGGTLTDNDLLG